MSYNTINITKYLEAWNNKEITKPIVITIGGYAGTGKSTVAGMIKDIVPGINVFPTGLARAIVQSTVDKREFPYLFQNTYDLDKVGIGNKRFFYTELGKHCPLKVFSLLDKYNEKDRSLIEKYLMQCISAKKAIDSMITFARKEHQHWIFDGNHILPGFLTFSRDILRVSFYMSVSDEKKHFEMLVGPTHSRTLDSTQLVNARLLHHFIVEYAELCDRVVFDENTKKEKFLEYIDLEIGKQFF